MDIEDMAVKLSALGHPTRIRILIELTKGENYLSEIAKNVGISRALAKVHLKKLKESGLVESKIFTLEEEARALRALALRETVKALDEKIDELKKLLEE